MEPQNVVLEKEKKKKTKKEKKVQGEKEKLEISAAEPFPGGLLQAIASFLQRHGFSKSLSAFNSEAHIEVDSLAADALEAIYSKHAKNRCENPNDGTSGVLKNGDSRAGTETTKDDFVASEETHKKKRKRCSDDENKISNSDIPNMGNDTAPPVDESSQPKEKKKKKNKLSANGGIVVDAEHNKEKLKPETMENSGLLKKADTSDVPQSLEQSIEEPKRKKREDKATASPEEDTLQDNGNKSQEKVNDLSINKKSEAVSNGSGYENERVRAKEKKKTKKEAPDNSTLVESEHGSLLNAQHSLDKLDGGSDLGKVEKHDLLKSDNAEKKKIKKKKEKIKHLIDEAKLSPEGARGDAKSDKTVVTTVQKQTEGAENGSEKDQTNGVPKLTEVNYDGTGEEKGHSGNSITKITKKDSKHSAEPKTVNAFRRVNPDEVRFADERLQDNSYWAKGGADTGYGAKAQEVLGQVRGKGFRHEKTKKKRGSYRGGQIDLQSHSIKFNYSDEE